ncbi:MAG: hypothetical protein QXN68_00830 [Thermoplasmata archaeon]
MNKDEMEKNWKKCEECGKWFYSLTGDYTEYLCRDCREYFEEKIKSIKEKYKEQNKKS